MMFHRCFAAILWLVLCQSAWGATTQVVLFTGFLSGAGPNTGMGILNSTLSQLGLPGYTGMVFEWNNKQGAFDWLQQTGNRTTLVIIGHSFGGNSTLQLANDWLKPVGITVDLTVQIDPVKNFDSGANDVLPTNVDVGYNYWQESTGFFEPQGEDFVAGATNIQAEVFFNDNSITHNSLDDDPRLHAVIGQHIFDNLNPESADFDFDGDVDGRDFLVWQRDPNVGSLGDWQQQYGTNPSLAASRAVPEPAGLVLLCCLALLAPSLRPGRIPPFWGLV